MRVTTIEVRYRLTESHDWSNVQVERRLVTEFPKQQVGDEYEVINDAEGAGWYARYLLRECQQGCERDVDDWLEQRGQPPRYYCGPRYVAWQDRRAEIVVVLPLGQEPDVLGNWSRLSSEKGMRLRSLRRAIARGWISHRRDWTEDWMILDTPAKVRAGQEEMDRRLRERIGRREPQRGFGGGPLGDFGEAGDGCDEAEEWGEDDDPPEEAEDVAARESRDG